MNRGAVTRKLAAILIADVVGFSRHMERDDAGAFARLREIRERVVNPKIAEYDGRIVKTAGDGMLLEFGSADSALRCAIDVQRAMSAYNQSTPLDERIEFRIGINLGDIIVDGTDIAGDGVNVAARLEALAEAGGICVSSSVREQVHGSMDVGFDDIGEQQVKNIMRPIRAYHVILGGGATHARSPTRKFPTRRRWLIAGIAALGALGVGIALTQQFMRLTVSPAPTPYSIAVLPLSAPSGAPVDEQLADRLTQDLTTALGRWRIAQVASLGLATAYRGKAVDARVAGRELNVRHVVEGEVGRAGDTTVVTLRVVDTATGTQEWSDRMEFEPGLLEAEPMALLARAYAHLRAGINGVERRRAVREPTSASALNLKLRGDAKWNSGSQDLSGVLDARRLYDEALRLDPTFVPALLGRLNTLHWELYENLDADRARFVAEMDLLSRRAVALDDQNPSAWGSRADALGWLGRWDEAFTAHDKAQMLDPAPLVFHLEDLAWLKYATGRPVETIALTERAIAIDPPGKLEEAMNLCRGNLMLGRYGEAVSACEKAATLDDATWHNQVLLLAASAQNGDMQKATVAKTELLKRQPRFSIAKDKAARLSDHPDYLKMLEAHYYPGLRKAGIPEQ